MCSSTITLAPAQQKLEDPFSEESIADQKAYDAAPTTWEVTCEAFFLPFDEAAKLKRSGKGIYQGLLEQVEKKKAVLEELSILKTTIGRKSTMEAIDEFIYPTEYDPPELPNVITSVPKSRDLAKMLSTPSNPTAYETRNTGVTMELAAQKLVTPTSIRADLSFTLVTLMGRDSWGQEKAEAELPRFHVQELDKVIVLTANQPVLAGTLSPPKPKKGEERRVWFFFVTARGDQK